MENEQLGSLITEYIKNASKIHKERAERLQQANIIIKKEISHITHSVQQIQKVKSHFNRELDEMISSMDKITQIERKINNTQGNLDKIDSVLDRIEHKLSLVKNLK